MSGAAPVRVRPIEPRDHAAVLALNETNVAVLSPMDGARLTWIASLATAALVAEDDEGPLGFCIAMPAGTAYDGAYYAWFAGRFDDFLYLDRVAVGERARRRGVGTLLYDAAEAIARPHGRMTCEVNVRPANEPSLGFHRSRGYAELGELDADETGEKRVVLLAKELPAA